MTKPPRPENENQRLLARLPSVHRLLDTDELKIIAQSIPHSVVTEAARAVLARLRERILAGGADAVDIRIESIAECAASTAQAMSAPSLRPAINATGIVLHTGLGRARLADAATEAIAAVARSHSTLEIDRESGRRGSRRDHVRDLICQLTGAENATVVNNCAGAVFLAVSTLAAGREVIISRGELVEIGGSFRMPDIIRSTGATLVEVGTTNRTRLSDYSSAITDRTGLILRCRPSNFAVVGFTEETPMPDLVELGRSHAIPVMDDQGSGSLISPALLGLPESKGSLPEAVSTGCDIVAASGDKLLGGPQAGILLGRREMVDRIASHPLARALRVDKFTLAALEATLRLYLDPEKALREIPTLRYLRRTGDEIARSAGLLRNQLVEALGDLFEVQLVSERSEVGGGSLPGEVLPTTCVAIASRIGSPSADEIAAHLRRHDPPIFARIKSDTVLFDPRTLEHDELDSIAAAAGGLVKRNSEKG